MQIKKKFVKIITGLISVIALTSVMPSTGTYVVQAKHLTSSQIKMQRAKSKYDVPKVKKFTRSILNKYFLEGCRWAKIKITYNDQALSSRDQEITEGAIKQINRLRIVKLIKTKKKANISIKSSGQHLDDGGEMLGSAQPRIRNIKKYKGLFKIIEQPPAKIILYTKTIRETLATNENYELALNNTVLHEMGHILGVGHMGIVLKERRYTEGKQKIKEIEYQPGTRYSNEIMSPVASTNIKTKDGLHTVLDQDYIKSLAILYQN